MEEKHTKQQPPNGPSWDRKLFSEQSSWNIVDDPAIMEDDDDDEEDYEPPAVRHSYHRYETNANSSQGPPPPKIPSGWKAIWNNQYNQYFFVNTYTKKARWQPPTHPAFPRANSSSPFGRHQNTSELSERISARTSNIQSNI